MLTQKVQARAKDIDGSTYCRYRGDNGTKCAIGCLIPDKLYDQKIEGITIKECNPLLFDILTQSGIDCSDSKVFQLLKQLQDIHDNVSPQYWDRELGYLENWSWYA